MSRPAMTWGESRKVTNWREKTYSVVSAKLYLSTALFHSACPSTSWSATNAPSR